MCTPHVLFEVLRVSVQNFLSKWTLYWIMSGFVRAIRRSVDLDAFCCLICSNGSKIGILLFSAIWWRKHYFHSLIAWFYWLQVYHVFQGFDEKDVYVCESDYLGRVKHFKKIKVTSVPLSTSYGHTIHIAFTNIGR